MANRIKSIPFKFSIDTVWLNNADATYTEFNPKTNQAGTIPVNKITLLFFPVKNYNFLPTDSLRTHINAYILDSIWVRLRLKESYVDTLSGFLMTVRIKPADARVLNPILLPLTSARIKSGYLDTLTMRVAGDEYLAFGDMTMLYHDLKVEIIKKNIAGKKSFFSGLLNFIANTFVIKNKNVHRTGHVFFIRNRERSSLNYLIKILLSGIGSTVSSKSDKKILRQYKKELRQRNLPPLDYD
jgi:hypothetical protein